MPKSVPAPVTGRVVVDSITMVGVVVKSSMMIVVGGLSLGPPTVVGGLAGAVGVTGGWITGSTWTFAGAIARAAFTHTSDAGRRTKKRYFLETPRYDAYDEKTLMQWTLYGLPMYAVK